MSTELHLAITVAVVTALVISAKLAAQGYRTNKESAHNEQTMNATILPLRKVLILLC